MGSSEPGLPTSTTTQETLSEKTAEIARKMNMETWQLVAILVGELKTLLCRSFNINILFLITEFALLLVFILKNI